MDLIDETLINKTSNGSSRIDGKSQKTAPVTYQSQISGDKNAIKIRIRKSNTDLGVEKKRRRSNKKTKNRAKDDADDDNDINDSNNNANSDAHASTNSLANSAQSTYHNSKAAACLNQEKGRWADGLPFIVLRTIFQYVCHQSNGAVPNLVRFSGVCRFWREVSQEPKLWKAVELSPYTKQKFMSDQTLHWILANRLSECEELNLNDWKALNITEIVFLIKEYCPDLKSIGLSGWINLTAEQLKLLVTGCTKLQKLDLSSINQTKINAKTAVSLSPLISLVEIMGDRLTNLILSHNKLSGLPQIVAAISNHCCNLELLDLSNIKPHSHTIPSIDLEKLQEGCRKLRVLRITNSQIILASSLLSQQAASPGFPLLEELSLAGVEEDQTTSKFIDDNGLDRILKSSQKLRLLDVRGCTKITGSGLVRVPAWDIQHLFLSASSITRCDYMGLGLVVQKWSHSLVEIDLAWASSCDLDPSIISLSESVQNPPLRKIDLCGSSVSSEPIKKLLQNCHQLQSINLQSCRGLPRGVKRLFQNQDLVELKNVLNKSELESTETTDNDD